MPVTLVLGGARSGKSSYAERWVKNAQQHSPDCALHYVATAIAFDLEMEKRIHHHRQQRGDGWVEHEIPVKLTQKLDSLTDKDIVLVDCLTLWLNNIIYNDGALIEESSLQNHIDKLVNCLNDTKANIVLVSNEVGMGIVPLGAQTRLFVDYAGWMNQKIAAIADNVVLVSAGLPISLKGTV